MLEVGYDMGKRSRLCMVGLGIVKPPWRIQSFATVYTLIGGSDFVQIISTREQLIDREDRFKRNVAV